MNLRALLPIVWAAALAFGCVQPEGGSASLTAQEREIIESLSLSRLPPPPAMGAEPPDTEAAALLGRRLFFDARLSRGGTMSCATCHRPDYAFTEPRPLAEGRKPLSRRTPTLVGAAWFPFLQWDGRKDSLWSQALGPLEAEDEHGTSRLDVARIVSRHHRSAYEAAFGPLPGAVGGLDEAPLHARPIPESPDDPHHRAWVDLTDEVRDGVNTVFLNVGRSLEAFIRKLRPEVTPFDRYAAALAEGDPSGGGHLSDAAVRGLKAFIGPAGCIHCHNGPLLTNFDFHNLGLPPVLGVPGDDPGREAGVLALWRDPFRCGGPHSEDADCPELRFLPGEDPDRLGAFKTPSLRGVAARPPYMHGGHFADLQAVVTFYRRPPGEAAIGRRDRMLHHIQGGWAPSDLLAFLEALTSEPPAEGRVP